jgi:hypothetical protein
MVGGLEGIWKHAVMALSLHIAEGTEEKNENPARIMCPGRNSSKEHPEYKSKASRLDYFNRSRMH